MERLQASSLEEALENYSKFKSWMPYRYSNLKYFRNLELDTWGFYATKPKLRKGETNITIYEIV